MIISYIWLKFVLFFWKDTNIWSCHSKWSMVRIIKLHLFLTDKYCFASIVICWDCEYTINVVSTNDDDFLILQIGVWDMVRIIKLNLFFNNKYCFASIRSVETVNIQLTSTVSTNDLTCWHFALGRKWIKGRNLSKLVNQWDAVSVDLSLLTWFPYHQEQCQTPMYQQRQYHSFSIWIS